MMMGCCCTLVSVDMRDPRLYQGPPPTHPERTDLNPVWLSRTNLVMRPVRTLCENYRAYRRQIVTCGKLSISP